MRQSFAPYGALVARDTTTAGASVPLRYGWTGREYDAETGWYYFRARYYAPQQRRFVQEDPIGDAGGPNLYAYVAGRVFDARDPSGLKVCDDWARCGSAGGPMAYHGESLAEIRAGGAIPGGMVGIGDDISDIFGDGPGYIPRQQARDRIAARANQGSDTPPAQANIAGKTPHYYGYTVTHSEELREAKAYSIDQEIVMFDVNGSRYIQRTIIQVAPVEDDGRYRPEWGPVPYEGYAYIGGYTGTKVKLDGKVWPKFEVGYFWGWTWK
jgi:RHS repeat-associated protein